MIKRGVRAPLVRTFVRPKGNHGTGSEGGVRRCADHSRAGRDVAQWWPWLIAQTGVFHLSFVP